MVTVNEVGIAGATLLGGDSVLRRQLPKIPISSKRLSACMMRVEELVAPTAAPSVAVTT
jgi:hypothetical protein